MPTHAHYAGEFGSTRQPGLAKDPAYRAARAMHYAKKTAEAGEAHKAALASGSKSEAAKHALVAAAMQKKVEKHASAAEKLAPGSEHAALAGSARGMSSMVQKGIEDRKKAEQRQIDQTRVASSSAAGLHDTNVAKRADELTSRARQGDHSVHTEARELHRRAAVSSNNDQERSHHEKLAKWHAKAAALTSVAQTMSDKDAAAHGSATRLMSEKNSVAEKLTAEANRASRVAHSEDKGPYSSIGPTQSRETRAANHYAAKNAHESAAVEHRALGNSADADRHQKKAEEHQKAADKLMTRTGPPSRDPQRVADSLNAAASKHMAVAHEEGRKIGNEIGAAKTKAAEKKSDQAVRDTNATKSSDTAMAHAAAALSHRAAATAHADAGNSEVAEKHRALAEAHEQKAALGNSETPKHVTWIDRKVLDSVAKTTSSNANKLSAIAKVAPTAANHAAAAEAHRKAMLSAAKAGIASGKGGDTDKAAQHKSIMKQHEAEAAKIVAGQSTHADATGLAKSRVANDLTQKTRDEHTFENHKAAEIAHGEAERAHEAEGNKQSAERHSAKVFEHRALATSALAEQETNRANERDTSGSHEAAAQAHGRALEAVRSVGLSAQTNYHSRMIDDHMKRSLKLKNMGR